MLIILQSQSYNKRHENVLDADGILSYAGKNFKESKSEQNNYLMKR